MLTDYDLCIQLCTQRGISPPLEILDAMKIGSSLGELRLNSLSIILPICEIIGRVLSSSSTIKSVDLSDCMLIFEGMSNILDALYDGSNITTLNLKGNNISGPIVVQLGDILYHNNTMKYLYLEWNALGSDIESFEKFCKGLCVNHNIEVIDLRYNQINLQCANDLSTVLKRNKSLKIINLSWNILGIKGGQLMLNGINENNNIIQLDLRGNCIPIDIIDTIDNCIYNNQSKKIISQSNISMDIDTAKIATIHDNIHYVRSINSDIAIDNEYCAIRKRLKRISQLSTQKKNLIIEQEHNDIDKNSHMDNDNCVMSIKELDQHLNNNELKNVALTSDDNIQMNKINSNDVELNKKIIEVNKVLNDRTMAINILKDEISVKDSEIEAFKLMSDQLKMKLNQLNDEHKIILQQRDREINDMKQLQKSNEDSWSKIYRELDERHKVTVEKNKEWEIKVRRYERDIHKSSLELISLREKLMNKSQSYDNLMAKCKTELHRGKIELNDKDNRHKIEINILKNTLKETTQALEECQGQLQKIRLEMRDTTVNLSNVKLKLSEMEQANIKYNRIDENLNKIKDEKSIVDEKFADSQRAITCLKRQLKKLQDELIEPQRRYNILNDELNSEKEKTMRLKCELDEERSRIKEQDVQMQIMNSQITSLNKQIHDIQRNYADDIRERDREKKQLKEMIIGRERDLNDLKAEEAQRASQLYAAFSKYLSSIGPNAPL